MQITAEDNARLVPNNRRNIFPLSKALQSPQNARGG